MDLETSESQISAKICSLENVTRTKFNNKWSGELIECTWKELEALTENFKEENLIGVTSYGKVYRGKIKLDSTGAATRDVIVKIWDDKADDIDDGELMTAEVNFLTRLHVGSHPNLVKVIANCKEAQHDRKLRNGVVYDLCPLDSLYNQTPKDNFSWMKRIKVALGFAKLLEFLHYGVDGRWPYVVFNIDSTNIMLDQEYNPILIDFGMLSGGRLGGPRFVQYFGTMSPGYWDPNHDGSWPETVNDVYAYGMILLGLIAKRVDKKEEIHKKGCEEMEKWARRVYSPSSSSLVHPSLKQDKYYDESDGMALTELVMSCIRVDDRYKRPQMRDVVYSLNELCVSRASNCEWDEDSHTGKSVKVV